MTTAKVFMTGRSQAVRLPKEYRFTTREVCVAKLDDMVILYPQKKGWAILERALKRFTEDFMADRGQPDAAMP
ncbi:MAG: type II toxin-antitoxin system VapB family antitoxin [Planctomycetota bacterium]|nr:type II toxin-antitoxin system VapB family antitoxin [Planctomycetota bacterium]